MCVRGLLIDLLHRVYLQLGFRPETPRRKNAMMVMRRAIRLMRPCWRYYVLRHSHSIVTKARQNSCHPNRSSLLESNRSQETRGRESSKSHEELRYLDPDSEEVLVPLLPSTRMNLQARMGVRPRKLVPCFHGVWPRPGHEQDF